MPEYLCSACICCYSSIDTELTICCASQAECLCCAHRCCISATEKPIEIGLIKDESVICKLGLYCCWYALKVPSVCCSGQRKCLCCTDGFALPFADPNPEPQCAVCFIKCLPEVGVLLPPTGGKYTPPEGGAPQAEEISR